MEEPIKGEVRRLADIFSTDDAERASQHVQNVIESHKHALHTLQKFAQENLELKQLVKELPKKISHSIMVPFGKVAFFPGRLVHTNEFLVLLGEGHYAERSAKQTVEILNRRGNLLKSRIDNVESQLADLDMESRFFAETLAEAAAGVVDIREEFVESESTITLRCNGEAQSMMNPTVVETMIGDSTDEDEEHKLLMARLDALEAAEAASEMDSENINEDGSRNLKFESDSMLTCKLQSVNKMSQKLKETKDSDKLTISRTDGRPDIRSPGDVLKFEEWKQYKLQIEEMGQTIGQTGDHSKMADNKSPPLSKLVHSVERTLETSIHEESRDGKQISDSPRMKEISSTFKAFTGTIVERAASSPLDFAKGSKETPKRPISKFKMRQSDR